MLFSPIDSEGTARWLSENDIDGFPSDSIHVFVENKLFSKSTAVLKLIPFLRPGCSLFLGLWLVPKCIRDWVYDLIAKNRQSLGRQCELMSVNKDRLL
jgi:predicted DCC family thiol-disulfide oxidoreductase YuxK